MDEHHFDALFPPQPFGTKEAARADAQLRRRTTLGFALWGRTSDDLQRQLLAPHPEIPPGFSLADFRDLLVSAEQLASINVNDPRFAAFREWMRTSSLDATIISAGTQRFTFWEARCEVVCRAIAYLEKNR